MFGLVCIDCPSMLHWHVCTHAVRCVNYSQISIKTSSKESVSFPEFKSIARAQRQRFLLFKKLKNLQQSFRMRTETGGEPQSPGMRPQPTEAHGAAFESSPPRRSGAASVATAKLI